MAVGANLDFKSQYAVVLCFQERERHLTYTQSDKLVLFDFNTHIMNDKSFLADPYIAVVGIGV